MTKKREVENGPTVAVYLTSQPVVFFFFLRTCLCVCVCVSSSTPSSLYLDPYMRRRRQQKESRFLRIVEEKNLLASQSFFSHSRSFDCELVKTIAMCASLFAVTVFPMLLLTSKEDRSFYLYPCLPASQPKHIKLSFGCLCVYISHRNRFHEHSKQSFFCCCFPFIFASISEYSLLHLFNGY